MDQCVYVCMYACMHACVCLSQALSRGVHFEIIYAPMIRDASARRSTITNANLLVELCRGKVISHFLVSYQQFASMCIPSMVF